MRSQCVRPLLPDPHQSPPRHQLKLGPGEITTGGEGDLAGTLVMTSVGSDEGMYRGKPKAGAVA